MSAELIFQESPSKHNYCVLATTRNWNRNKSGGTYDNGRDFFSVHWEIHLPKPRVAKKPQYRGEVRLHVESPSYARDRNLNNIKHDVITALRASSLRHIAQQKGYAYKEGARAGDKAIQ